MKSFFFPDVNFNFRKFEKYSHLVLLGVKQLEASLACSPLPLSLIFVDSKKDHLVFGICEKVDRLNGPSYTREKNGNRKQGILFT